MNTPIIPLSLNMQEGSKTNPKLSCTIRCIRLIQVVLLVGSLLTACSPLMASVTIDAVVEPTYPPPPTPTPGPISGIKLYGTSAQAEVVYQSQLRSPEGITIGPDGDLYIADWLAYRIMRLSRAGDLSIAVQLPQRGSGSSGPRDVAFDNEGRMYVVTPSEILRITRGGDVEPIVIDNCCMSKIEFGPDGSLYFANERTNEVQILRPDGGVEVLLGGLEHPFDITFSPEGEMYISEFKGDILRVNQDGEAEYFGKADPGSFDPKHMAFDREGNLYVHGNGTLYKFDPLGNQVDVGMDGDMLGFPKANPGGITFDETGNLYVADSPNAKIIRISPQMEFDIVMAGFNPNGIALNAEGDIYAASSADFPIGPGEVWRIHPSGQLEVIAKFDDEAAQAIAVDSADNVYVSLIGRNGSRVVRVLSDGKIENFLVGNDPYGTLATGLDGDLYVSLPSVGEIHHVNVKGSTVIFARNLTRGEVHFFTLASSPEGILYAADSNTGNILQFSEDGSYEVISHLRDLVGFPNALCVAQGRTLFVQTGGIPLNLYRVLPSGDYERVASDVWGDPVGLTLDGKGNLYVSRGGSIDRIRGLTMP
jgi:sugar lactone lactonase YvrE